MNRYLLCILFGTLFFGGPKIEAITIDDYNNLSDDDAHRLLLYLADGAIKYLNTHGDPAMAKKAKNYFTKGVDDEDVGLGYVVFVMEAQIVAITNAQNAHDPTKPQYPVESAFAMALKQGGITGIPLSAIAKFGQGFKPSAPSSPPKAAPPAPAPSGH